MQRTKNPILSGLDKVKSEENVNSASYVGISVKTGILLLTTIIAGAFAWLLLGDAKFETVVIIMSVTGITAFISVMIASFIPRVAMPFSILYTLAQGFTLGVLTFLVEQFYGGQGISIMALVITVVIFGVMLALYSSRTLRVTNTFRKIMYTGIIAILIVSIISIFIPEQYNVFYNNPVLGIALSLFLILYGAFMLALNFDQAERTVTYGLDKNYEWSVALGLMITIIWIYVEVIRLLVLILGNRD